jgi:hypothetical protein
MKNTFYILFLILTTSCGISEDCFKGNGNSTILTFPFEGFTKVKVYPKVALVIKEGTAYEVRVETQDNIKDRIEVVLEGDLLTVKDNTTCNIARDYGLTTVYITAPNLEEIHSKTEQDVKSDGILHYGLLRLFSIGDDGDGSGTGDFYIHLDSNGQFVVESNTMSNYYLQGNCKEMLLNFYFGDGRFYGENLEVEKIKLYQRGSNDMIVKPMQRIEGQILATGDVILKSTPPEIEIEALFTGQLIYE